MMIRRIGWVFCFILLTGCPAEPEPNSDIPQLTETQVKRFLASYVPVNAMASQYWGDRRYTKPGKILPRKGGFERAIKEMKAAGKLPEFQKLLATHGFADFAAWRNIKERVGRAQMEIAMDQRGRSNDERFLKRRQRLERQIAEIRINKGNMPPEAVQRRIESVEQIIKETDKYLLAIKDKNAVRPFMPQFEAVFWEYKKKRREQAGPSKAPATPSKVTGNPA